jgi:hypothetical protein
MLRPVGMVPQCLVTRASGLNNTDPVRRERVFEPLGSDPITTYSTLDTAHRCFDDYKN